MEYQLTSIFILVFCFIIVEPIPAPEEEGRYGTQPLSSWPKNANHSRQHQKYPSPQSFYPTVNNNNQDHRSFERNYDNRHDTGDKRPFYEGINSRRVNNQPSPSINTSGTNIREKSFDGELPYRRRRHEYGDRYNGRYPPHLERQQSADRSHRAPRTQFQRSMSENSANRYRDFTQPQRQSYFEKQIHAPNRPASPVNFRYSAQSRGLDTVPETWKSPSVTRYSPPEVPASFHHRLEINKMLSQPKIQKYLASNHKRYLVLHTDGTVEHVDNLVSLIKNYPNYVMVKTGDIITNPKNSSLELISTAPREEIISSEIPKVMQRIPSNQNEFATYGYNPRVPYVTEKAYAQPIGRPVNIPYEDDGIVEPVEMTTLASRDISFFSERTTEYAYTPTHFVEPTTEYGPLTSLFETSSDYGVSKPSITTTEYTVSIPFVDTTEDLVTYADSADSEETYTQMPIEILSENPITDASLLVTTQDDSTLTPTTIIRNDEYLDNAMLPMNTFAPKEEPTNDIISMMRGFYPSAFGNFIRKHFGPSLHVNKYNSAENYQNTRHLEDAESATNPFNVTNILDAITEVTVASTTEKTDVSFYVDDINTTIPDLEDLIYTTPVETSSQFYDYQTVYPETRSISDNEDIGTLNPFVNTNDEQISRLKHKTKSHPKQIYVKPTETTETDTKSSYNVVTNDNNNTSELPTTRKHIVNPFFPFDEPHTESASVDESAFSTETDIDDNLNPFLANYNKNTNPFFESTTTQNPNRHRRIRNKKKIKQIAENYSETNPFIANPIVSRTIPTEEIADKSPDPLNANNNESVLNPFTDTNPFAENIQNPFLANVGEPPNIFTEYNTDYNITLSPIETTANYYNPIVREEPENVNETDNVPYSFLATENSSFELTAKAIPNFDTISENYEVPTTTEDVLLLTTTEKPTVWFKMDGELWEKLSNGSVPYDVVYFFQLHAKPLVEKDAKTTIFPNGTIVQEFIETVWEREGDPAPLLVKSSKTVYPDEGA